MRFIIKKQSSWIKTLFCRHKYHEQFAEAAVSDLPNDKFVFRYDTCLKCGLQWQETLQRPSPRTMILKTTCQIKQN